MKSSLSHFDIPEEVKAYLKKYDRFRAKRFFESSMGKFYVGTEVRYMGCTKLKQGGNGWNPVLNRIVSGETEYVKFTKSESSGFEDIVFIFESLEDLLDDFEPVTDFKKEFKFRLKIGKLEIVIR